ncbi:MAG: hypothetical protein A3A04_01730 [Candidatus Harrisonbacteria bacterium RIFCSPLOWO2_01_FULL_40_28]|uniref:Uncharacterized protein n=1 Tax=Candidatus Harrisonbacteria bacterium RIFCSPLOWO2_01_FULL_40_28 TaxID=1798406 RepID=A0A1G1ZLQ8_9BACT|nr:MAG: hypothetical protein A3A04_01730 [Candidatus Harrisonbacteria bacterium RIFCSPLOWO2_01_FULL_40_28]
MFKITEQHTEAVKKEFGTLSKKVATHYVVIGEELGFSEQEIEDLSIAGAIMGYEIHQKKKDEKCRKKYKIAPYLTWWMRYSVHKAFSGKILEMAMSEKEKADKILLALLDE